MGSRINDYSNDSVRHDNMALLYYRNINTKRASTNNASFSFINISNDIGD